MKSTFVLCSLVLLLGAILAFDFVAESNRIQESTWAKMYGPIWENAQKQVLDIAEAMPEDKYSYRPTDISRTFAEQLMHIGYSSKYIAEAYLKGVQAEYEDPSPEGMSKAEIIKFLKESLAACGQIYQELSEEELNQQVTTFGGNTMSKRQMIISIHDHLTNHKAKANLYVRMNGIEPPPYGYY